MARPVQVFLTCPKIPKKLLPVLVYAGPCIQWCYTSLTVARLAQMSYIMKLVKIGLKLSKILPYKRQIFDNFRNNSGILQLMTHTMAVYKIIPQIRYLST